MSATAANTTANGVKLSPVEYVRGLPPEEKQAVFLALLREAVADNGDTGLLPIDDEAGKPFGYYVPPKAAAERAAALLPKLSPEREAELARRQTEPGQRLSADEFRAWLTQEAPAQGQ